MTRLNLLRFCLSLLLTLPFGLRADDPVFRIGVAPHTSARIILEMYQPLRLALEKSLGQAVVIETAPDFTEFGRRALRQTYDIAITTGHQARIYEVDGGYLPLITYKAGFKAIALVAKNSPYRSPVDLKGSNPLGLSPTSLVSLWGLYWLRNNNLGDLPIKYVSAADSVSNQVLAGEASVGFTSLANFQKLPAEQQEALNILAESESMAGRIYMLNQRRSKQFKAIEQAIQQFGHSPVGKAYLSQNKLEGYRPLRQGELESMEPYAKEIRQLLKSK